MKNSTLFAIVLPSVIVVILFATVFNPARRDRTQEINSFEECIAAGNPALESYPRQCNTKDGKHFVEELGQQAQGPNNSTPTTFTENWETYTNKLLGLSFPYPTGYELRENQATEDSYYISLISPLDPNKPPKQTTLGENELKIEIVTEPSFVNDFSERCLYDHTENSETLSRRAVTVSGETVFQFDWEGLGDGQFICVIKNGTRYMINKYPLETSLQNDYQIFLDNLLISDI